MATPLDARQVYDLPTAKPLRIPGLRPLLTLSQSRQVIDLPRIGTGPADRLVQAFDKPVETGSGSNTY
jgi:hypothetical protein